MATRYSPSIVKSGLVLCLDASSTRSYPIFRGSNLITNGEFTTDTTAWAGYGGTTLSRVTASSDPGVPSGGTDDYCLKVNGTYFAYDPISTATGKHYFVRLRGYDASGGNSLKISATSDGATLTGVPEVTVSGAEWKTYTSSFIAEGTTTYIRIGANSGGGSVSYWDKVEVYEAVWADLSGQGTDGVINGLDGLSAESGAGGTKSFDFDGTSDYVALSTSTWGAESFCISMWIKADVLSGYQMLFGGSGYGGGNGIGHYLYGTTIRTWIATGSGAVNILNAQTLSTGTWYNIIFQRDYGVAFNWYLNGQNINNYSSNYLTTALSSPNSTIAKHYNSTSYNFNGKIPIVHVYNRALTATEVSQNYNAHKGRFGL